jgi:hypothetical protein
VKTVEERDTLVVAFAQQPTGVLDQAVTRRKGIAVLFVRDAVDLGDAGTGDNVVKLVEQDRLPNSINRILRILIQRKRGPEHFDGAKFMLQFAVSPFHPSLRGQSPAM